MGRPPPDPRRADRAWELCVEESRSFREAAQIIGEEFGCPPPAPSTVRLWSQQNRTLRDCYHHLLHAGKNRELAAFRYRRVWAMVTDAIQNSEVTAKEGIDLLLRIIQGERKMFGMDAATKVAVESGAAPTVSPDIVAALRSMQLDSCNER